MKISFHKSIIVFFNILLVMVLLVCIDYMQYKSFLNEYKKKIQPAIYKIHKIPPYTKCFNRIYSTNSIQSFKSYYKDGEWGYLRKTYMEDSKKPSIILFGGSFTYGSFLKDEQTFSYKLSQHTGRAVYNRGIEAGGLAQMLYFLQDDNFYKKIKQPPEYVIYTYITNHQKRLNTNMYPYPLWLSGYNLQYKIKNDKLVIKQDWPAFIYEPFIMKKIYALFDKINNRETQKNINKRFELTNKIFLESKKLVEDHYPNAKFVVIDYNFDYNFEKNDLPQLWDVLEKEGFIVLHTKDLIGRKFSLEETEIDEFHPSEKVWDLLVPALVKKLNL